MLSSCRSATVQRGLVPLCANLCGDPDGRPGRPWASSPLGLRAHVRARRAASTARRADHVRRGRSTSSATSQRQLLLQRVPRGAASRSGVPVPRQVGYCQQFSGAMALMLRMIGIPARVAAGFAPGSRTRKRRVRVRDLDAHSWVEVYFNGIGWVPFDPTPAAAPAERSRRPDARLSPPEGGDQRRRAAARRARPSEDRRRLAPGAGGGASLWLLLPLGLLCAGAGLVAWRVRTAERAGSERRSWPRRSWRSCAALCAPELGGARGHHAARTRAAARARAGPAAARYAAGLRRTPLRPALAGRADAARAPGPAPRPDRPRRPARSGARADRHSAGGPAPGLSRYLCGSKERRLKGLHECDDVPAETAPRCRNLLAGVLGGLVVLVVGAILIETDVIDTGDTTTRGAPGADLPAGDQPRGHEGRQTVQQIYKQEGRGVVFIQSEGVSEDGASAQHGHGHRLGLRRRQGRHDHHQRPRGRGRLEGDGQLRGGRRRRSTPTSRGSTPTATSRS